MLILSPALKRWGPMGMGWWSYIATRPIFGPDLVLSQALKLAEPRTQQGMCMCHFRNCTPLRSTEELLDGRSYVAAKPTCGPLVILSTALKR